MFDRLQKSFLTVETGEAWQPVRLTYELLHSERTIAALESLGCIRKGAAPLTWNWYWQGECDDLHFDSIPSYQRNGSHPVRLATLKQQTDVLHIHLNSFKRACMAVPFFHRLLGSEGARIRHADFVNRIFAVDERLPHGFSELFSEAELEAMLYQRIEEYQRMRELCEHAVTAEEALDYMVAYAAAEEKKRLPYAERYVFLLEDQIDPDVIFLGFYIYLRGREMVAVRRWLGETGYTLREAVEESVESIFGAMGIDLID